VELRVAVGDESKVDELHSLRKHLKRLRYTLELFPSVERQSRLVADLRRWQDVLGEIRDGDVVLDYLSRARPTRAVREVIASERTLRHSRYVYFVNSSRRRPIGRPLRFADAGGAKAAGARSES
jgi:CHAD domain-containing protein